MTAVERLDEIEVRLLSPMVTYKENATEDAPALVAALRAVLAEIETQRGSVLGGLVSPSRLVHLIEDALDVTS